MKFRRFFKAAGFGTRFASLPKKHPSGDLCTDIVG
jgi:hypothetical protein